MSHAGQTKPAASSMAGGGRSDPVIVLNDDAHGSTLWLSRGVDVGPKVLEVARASKAAVLVTEAAAPFSIVGCNSVWSNLCEYAPEECMGRSPKILQGSGTDQAAAEQFATQCEVDGQARVTLINYTKHGRRFLHRLNSVRVHDDTGKSFYVTLSSECHCTHRVGISVGAAILAVLVLALSLGAPTQHAQGQASLHSSAAVWRGLRQWRCCAAAAALPPPPQQQPASKARPQPRAGWALIGTAGWALTEPSLGTATRAEPQWLSSFDLGWALSGPSLDPSLSALIGMHAEKQQRRPQLPLQQEPSKPRPQHRAGWALIGSAGWAL